MDKQWKQEQIKMLPTNELKSITRSTNKIEITKQIVAQGSYGIYKINPRNGQWRSHVILVWHAKRAGKYVGTFRSREEARKAVHEPQGQAAKPAPAGRG